MKYLIILLSITMTTLFNNKSEAQTVYYPAGNKAYEKKDSIVTFFSNGRPIRRIDLKNGSDTDLIKQEVSFLHTHEWNSDDKVFKREYRYNDLGMVSYCKYIKQGHPFVEEGEYPIRYDEYGHSANHSNKYNDYGNIITDGRNHFVYDDKQNLLHIYEKRGNDTITESHNILDAQGRTRIFYTYHHEWKEISLYKEIEYPNDTTFVASRIMDYKADRQDRGYVFIIEDNWEELLKRKRVDLKVFVGQEVLPKMDIEQFGELFSKIRKDEYRNKPEWFTRYDMVYNSSKRLQKVFCSEANERGVNWLHEYKYDEMGRQLEQINYTDHNATKVDIIYFQSYDPGYYDF